MLGFTVTTMLVALRVTTGRLVLPFQITWALVGLKSVPTRVIGKDADIPTGAVLGMSSLKKGLGAGGGGGVTSTIVKVAFPAPIVPPTGFDSVKRTVSDPSETRSSMMGTSKVFDKSPALKVSVPDTPT